MDQICADFTSSEANRVALLLRREIEQRHLRPGERLPGPGEARRRYRATRNELDTAVAILAHQGLVVRDRELGPVVAPPRLAPVYRRSQRRLHGAIALVGKAFEQIGNSYYWSEIASGIMEASAAYGMKLLYSPNGALPEEQPVDGAIYSPWLLPSGWEETAPAARVCVMGTSQHSASVCGDDYQGVREATRQLVNMGHTRIAYLHSSLPSMAMRLESWHEALEEAGITPSSAWTRALDGDPYQERAYADAAHEAMTDWIYAGFLEKGCTALLAHNDFAALGAVQAMQNQGVRVPRQISVVGFDDQLVTEHLRPRLASLRVPLREIGQRSVEMLMERIENPTAPIYHLALPHKPVMRESATMVPVEYPALYR